MGSLSKIISSHSGRYLTGALLLVIFVLACTATAGAQQKQFAYIEEMFDLRERIIAQGEKLPDIIRQTRGTDMRTMERVFELNTSALTTIEAYFRIFKMAITAKEGKLTPEIVTVMNEWLVFIRNQSKYDLEYLNAAYERSEDQQVKEQVDIARQNIRQLSDMAGQGMKENREMLGELSE